MRIALRVLGILAAVAALGLAASPPAEAHRGRSHFSLGLNFGPYWWGPPRYYYPPPVYYAPPPAYYYAPPRVVAPAPACRVFQGDATIDASGAPFYGRACLQADGRWHIVD